ncbi:MAG: (4Fe-4S)-binding protein [Flavobacteriaceae bacterium]|nr:(4Fe-4S)-binding protein [Flavobacteriaceae bacterium]
MDSAKKIVKEYTNGDVTVVWQPHMCTHSKKCWKELLPVFDPRRKPWVDMNAAPSERIIAQVSECPSRALSIK